MMTPYHVIIIGGGIGGLCCGLRLLHAGYQVSIYEKCSSAGGVIQSLPSLQGYPDYDSFASIGIHPDAYYNIFTDVGLCWQDYFTTLPLDLLYRVFYEDGSSFTFSRYPDLNEEAFEAFYGESFAHYNAFLTHFYEKYRLADSLLLNQPLIHPTTALKPHYLSRLIQLNPFISAALAIKHAFKNPKLQNYLLYQTYYMGISPTRMSQLYATIPACTQIAGLVHIKGGMGAYAKALEKAFLDCNGHLYCNEPILHVLTHQNRAYGIITRSGQFVKGDLFISDADYSFTQNELITPSSKHDGSFLSPWMTCSVFMLRLTLSIHLPMLCTHNIYLVRNTFQTFTEVDRGMLPMKFPMYIYYPSHIDATFNTNHSTTLNIMVRVPNLSAAPYYWSPSAIQKMRMLCLKELAHLVGVETLRPYILHEAISTPLDLKEKFNLSQGAAFGVAPSFTQSAWLHPQPISPSIKNLYFTGTSIHPGNGISIVMKGAKVVSDLIGQTYPCK